jgi:5-methylthioadenosine/S-adenosylhomocysteine deaminase
VIDRTEMEKADLLITNAKIWSEENRAFSTRAVFVAIREGRILEIGEQRNLAEVYSAGQIWDAGGKLLLPGFVNTHCHLFQVFMRGLGKDLPFLDWVHQSVRLILPWLDEEAVYLAALIGCFEAIRTGTTTLIDFMYANVKPRMAEAVLRAFDECGIRGVLARGATDVEWLPGSPLPSITYAPVEDSLADLEGLLSVYRNHPRIRFMLAPNVVWGMTRDGLAELARYAKSRHLMVTMHLLETMDDDQYSQERYGMRTTRLLEEVGILNTDFLAVHAIQLQAEDIDLLARSGAKVSYNPVANMILGAGVAPIPELYRRGIPIGLGTDGAASNDSQSLMEVMKSAVLLQKVHHHDPTALSARQAFAMATHDGARAIQMDDQIGALSPGMCADILVVDLDVPNTTPCYDPISSLVYSGNERNISSVFIGGQCVLEAGKITRLDEAAVIHQASQKARELYKVAYGR